MDIRFWQNLPKDTFKRIFSKGPQPGGIQRLVLDF